MKLKEILELWLNKYAKLTLKLRSYTRYANTIRLHINPIIGEYEITEITSTILQDYVIEKLKNGNLTNHKPLASNTVYSIVSILKQAFQLALNQDLIIFHQTIEVLFDMYIEKYI